MSAAGPRRPAYAAPVSSNVRQRRRRPALLRQSQRLSACVEQPQRGQSANDHTPAQARPVSPSPDRATVARRSSTKKSMVSQYLIEPMHCVRASGFESVCRAAGYFHPYTAKRWRRLEDAACKHPKRGAGGRNCVPARVPKLPQARRRPQRPALPNPSLNRSANGRPPGPPSGQAYHPLVGPGVLPLAPG